MPGQPEDPNSQNRLIIGGSAFNPPDFAMPGLNTNFIEVDEAATISQGDYERITRTFRVEALARPGDLYDYTTSVKPPKQKRKVVDMDIVKDRALRQALTRFLQERDRATSARNLPNERRESEYLSLMESQSNQYLFTARQILESELPIHLDGIQWDEIHQIAEQGHPDIVVEADNTRFICSTCSTRVPQYFSFFCMGRLYCAEHIPQAEECIVCHNIQEDAKFISSIEGKAIRICKRCMTRTRCKNCDNMLDPRYAEARVCSSCYSKTENRYPRPYSKNTTWMSQELGEFVQSPRIFSAELETNIPQTSHVAKLIGYLPGEVGLSDDGSIRGSGIGVELQTPRLQGKRGEELVLRTTSALRAVKASVNESCGFHIHLDGADLFPASRREYPASLIQLWKAHLIFEDVILSFLPFRRRTNRYCRPLRDYFKVSELSLLTSMFEMEQLWYKSRTYLGISEDKGHHYHPSRYFGVNLHSLLAERNLEVRYHSGTINAKKIFHWVNLHSLIMDAGSRKEFRNEFLENAQATTDLRDKTKMLFSHIGLNEKTQRYFLDRQRRFNDKKVGEEGQVEVTPTPRIITGEWISQN